MLFRLEHHGWYSHGNTISQATKRAFCGLLNEGFPDAVLNIESHAFNVLVMSKTCHCQLDMGKELWLNKQRWSRLIREYVPREGVETFIEQAKLIMSGGARDGAVVNMMFRDPKRYAKKHRWGGCLMGATFGGVTRKNQAPCITFYSRTSYIGYIGFLDAAIASVIARHITDDLSEIKFRWHISSMQCHCFKSLPYIYSSPRLYRKLCRVAYQLKQNRLGALRKTSPTWINMAKWQNKVTAAWKEYGQDMLDHEKYGPFRRIKRRWMEHMGYSTKNIPPSVTVDELTLEKAE
jgi:hypothetical protein